MESQALTPDIHEDIIGSATSVTEITSALAKRGCLDLTSSINLRFCSELPYAGGGFCDVYRGRLNNNTMIAIKSLRIFDGPDADNQKTKILKHAARELYYWSKLRHRNVLPLIGLALFRGQISMVSEWMDNGTLVSYLRLNPDANRILFCMDIGAGLDYIHANGMVHGDLKAVNVMVSSHGVAMIADFGNSQLKDLTLKFSNTTKSSFSVRWAAPELLLAENDCQASKEADVYAYGMTALEVLTGKLPFEDVQERRVMMLVAFKHEYPPRPDIILDDGLWELLTSCWTPGSAERPNITSVRGRLQALYPDCGPSVDQSDQVTNLGLSYGGTILELSIKESMDHHILCRGCNNPIKGVRYQCATCPSLPTSYNLCCECDLKSYMIHDPYHVFLKLPRPVDWPIESPSPVIPVVYSEPAGGLSCLGPEPQAYLQELVHTNAICDICVTGMVGEWFRCITCGQDNCDACESIGGHDPTHIFVVFKSKVDTMLFSRVVDLSLSSPPPIWPHDVYRAGTHATKGPALSP